MSKISNTVALVTLALAGVSGTAFAQEATYEYPQALSSSLTRAEVQAERVQARLDGTARVWSTSYNHMAAIRSVKTRAQVQAELLATTHAEREVLTAEDSGSFALSRPSGVRPAGALLAAR